MKLSVSSPCPMNWSELVGNDRIRFCAKCRLNVYNFSVMRPEEVESIVQSTSGRLCGRIYDRGDGTATVQDCGDRRRKQIFRRAMAAIGLLLLGVIGWIFRMSDEPDRGIYPPLIKKGLDLIDPHPWPGRHTMGIMVPRTPPPPPPTPSAPEQP